MKWKIPLKIIPRCSSIIIRINIEKVKVLTFWGSSKHCQKKIVFPFINIIKTLPFYKSSKDLTILSMEKIALFLVEMERKNISLYFSGFFLFLHFHKAFTLCKSLRELKCQKIIFTVMFLFLRWKVFFLFLRLSTLLFCYWFFLGCGKYCFVCWRRLFQFQVWAFLTPHLFFIRSLSGKMVPWEGCCH